MEEDRSRLQGNEGQGGIRRAQGQDHGQGRGDSGMNAPQRTDEWHLERLGCATASRFSDAIAKIKTGEAATRKKYRIQLVTERLTGRPVMGYQNAAMMWG